MKKTETDNPSDVTFVILGVVSLPFTDVDVVVLLESLDMVKLYCEESSLLSPSEHNATTLTRYVDPSERSEISHSYMVSVKLEAMSNQSVPSLSE